ncbi:hypothetical protein AKJ09_07600 [Labilithrix luteola]|uniref:Uncharacterized protein n=1 Tax=Labilithrix luteola TaxID=1391654 RepID=A0A0K1Q5K6_9BACT|nr:hypothetical protein [Labilithrix luteola]AKV00937.1 hypothetical protein AKJ09_07600 [Labilithrix luteola]
MRCARSRLARISDGPSVLAFATPVLVLMGASATVTACGARGPLEADPPVDAAVADAATADVETVQPTPADAGQKEPSLLACGDCLASQCSSSILACIQAPACRDSFLCVAQDCLSSGSFDLGCMTKCASGDTSGLFQMLDIYQCVTSTCGPDCGTFLQGALGALGGGNGNGNGNGKNRDAGARDASSASGGHDDQEERASAAQDRSTSRILGAFSRWPELVSRPTPSR